MKGEGIMYRLSVAMLVAILTTAQRSPAQDVTSGPTKGEKAPPLKVYAATGPHEGKEVDYVKDRKDKPTVYVLIRSDKFSRPIARFMKKLDGTVTKDHKDASVVAVWLTDDAEKTKEYLPRAQQSLSFENTALTSFSGKAGPKGWGINEDADVTVVIVSKRKVAATFGYRSINETNAKGVRAALVKAVGKQKNR
jgi:hypothetical protein